MEFKLNTLPQELVNQIAAGEVIERPCSVVKELVDNSIDARANRVQIKVVNGGMDLIEVSDNGVGIPFESLENIFKAHTTTKISSLEDLNSLLTMGFRGEALSTIVSVANVSLTSKYSESDIAGEIQFKSFNDFTKRKAARESGTVITVKNIFESIPARRKFLKTAQTEYRKILEILEPYFLIYPNIHFVLIKDEKKVLELESIPNSKPNSLEKERVQKLLKGDFVERMVKVFFDGSGTKITGLIGHPSDHQKRRSNQYIFVNSRPIWDSGISKAVLQGYERYIPFGEKVPYILLLDIKPELIDVNVHPRKEEIRFLNPFRVYSAVEEAVKKSLISLTSYRKESEFKPQSSEGKSFVNKDMNMRIYSSKDIVFKPVQSNSVKDSLLFSKEALQESGYAKSHIQEKDINIKDDIGGMRNIFQVFNKYIVVEFDNDTLWIVDQHAAAERVTFEKLKREDFNIEKQNLLVPTEVSFSPREIEALIELKGFFSEKGIEYLVEGNMVRISAIPVEFVESDLKKLFDEIFSLSENPEDISKEINKLQEDILATMACHGSVRSGQYLHREEMIDLIKNLTLCENPYSCPHGRPAVWKLKLSEIDANFERTY